MGSQVKSRSMIGPLLAVCAGFVCHVNRKLPGIVGTALGLGFLELLNG